MGLIISILCLVAIFNIGTIIEFVLIAVFFVGDLLLEAVKFVIGIPMGIYDNIQYKKRCREEAAQQAKEENEKRKYQERLNCLRSFTDIKQLPEDQTLLVDLGELCEKSGDMQRALLCFEKSAELQNPYAAYRAAQLRQKEAKTAAQWQEVVRYAQLAGKTAGASELLKTARINYAWEAAGELIDQGCYADALIHFKQGAELGDGACAMQCALITANDCSSIKQALDAEKYLEKAEQCGFKNEEARTAILGIVRRWQGRDAYDRNEYGKAIDFMLQAAEYKDSNGAALAAIMIVKHGESDADYSLVPALCEQAVKRNAITREKANKLCEKAENKLSAMAEQYKAGEAANAAGDINSAAKHWMKAAAMGHREAAKELSGIVLAIAIEINDLDAWEAVADVCEIAMVNYRRTPDENITMLYDLSRSNVALIKGNQIYERGDEKEALRLWKEGAALGSGVCGLKAAALISMSGNVKEKDLEEALSLIEIAKKQKVEDAEEAEELIVKQLHKVRGTAAQKRNDYAEAIRQFKAAADLGDIDSALKVASIHILSYATKDEHWDEAYRYAKKAASAGNEFAWEIIEQIPRLREYSAYDLERFRNLAREQGL